MTTRKPLPPIDPALATLLAGPNFGHVSTLMADGSPHSAAVWLGTEAGRVLFYKEDSSVALRNLRRDPRVAISLVDVDDPYVGGYLRGAAIEFRGEPRARRWLTERALEYTSKPYPAEHLSGPGTVVVVEVERSASYHVDYMKHLPAAP